MYTKGLQTKERHTGERNEEPGLHHPSGIEIRSLEEFFDLLGRREARRVGLPDAGYSVLVSRTLERRGSRFGHPLVTRSVVAAFAYDETLVYYGRITSNAVELPETVAEIEDRQQEAYEEIRSEIECRLIEFDLHVAVHEGILRHPTDIGRIRRDESG